LGEESENFEKAMEKNSKKGRTQNADQEATYGLWNGSEKKKPWGGERVKLPQKKRGTIHHPLEGKEGKRGNCL